MKNVCYLFILLLMVVGCNDKQNSKIECDLVGYIPDIDVNLPYMRLPYRVELDNDMLVVMDLVSDSMHYHFLNYSNLSYLYSAGKRGQGPNEIILSTPFQLKNDKAYFLDGARSKLYTYSYSKDKLEVINEWKLGDSKTTLDFIIVNDSNVVTQDFSGSNRLLQITRQNQEGMFSIPTMDEGEGFNAELAYIWRSFMAYNDDLGKVALATQFGDVIEIYDLENKSSEVGVGDKGMPKNNQGQIEGFCDVKWIDNKIYALFSGRLRADLIRKSEEGKKEPTGGNIIKVYDENGKFLEMYHLDTYINGFTIDKQNERLIAVTSNVDEAVLFFDMK